MSESLCRCVGHSVVLQYSSRNIRAMVCYKLPSLTGRILTFLLSSSKRQHLDLRQNNTIIGLIPCTPSNMTIPKLGTYTSDDGVHKVNIMSANPAPGEIQGEYTSSSSPIGQLFVSNMTGKYWWVSDVVAGTERSPPFVISFLARQRPSGFPYAIVDHWNGAYQSGDKLLLSGTRSYVNQEGVVQVVSLGTKEFSM